MKTYLLIAFCTALILGAVVAGGLKAQTGLECDSSACVALTAMQSRLEGKSLSTSAVMVTSTATPVSGSTNLTPSSARIRLVSPVENAIVPLGDLKVEIATENFTLEASHRWRVYLDGKLIDTVENGVTSYTLPVTVSGPHEIKTTLSDAQRDDLASATVNVTAAPATPTTSPFNLPWVAAVMGALLVGVVALILISLRLTRRPAAP